jgi:hypothetical protein
MDSDSRVGGLMKREFKVGERVKIYQEKSPMVGVVKEAGRIHPSYISVEVGGKIIRPHVKQCRRLVKRRRREFWIAYHNDPGYAPEVFKHHPDQALTNPYKDVRRAYKEVIHVVESKKKEKR